MLIITSLGYLCQPKWLGHLMVNYTKYDEYVNSRLQLVVMLNFFSQQYLFSIIDNSMQN